MNRRAFLSLAALAAAAAGCGRVAPPDRRIPVELWTLSLKPTYTPFLDGLTAGFERLHSDLRVEWLDLPERILMQKLLASMAGGEAPDVVNLGSDSAMEMAQNNALVPTAGLVTAAERRRYFPQFWSSVRVARESFSIPWYVSISVLMYNRGIFRQAGLNPRRPPRTRAQFEQCARAIRRTGVYGFLPPIRILEDWQMDGLPILDASRRHAVFATPAHAAVLAWYARLRAQDLIPPETVTGGYTEAVRRYKAGTLGMLITGPQFLLTIRQDAPDVYAATGVAPLMRGRANIVPAAVMHFVIPRDSHHYADAARLALYLTDDANQLAFCKLVPILPSTIAAARDDYFRKGAGKYPLMDEAIRIDAEQLPYARDLNLSLPRMQELMMALRDAVEAAVDGRGQPLDLLRQAAGEWDRILAESSATPF